MHKKTIFIICIFTIYLFGILSHKFQLPPYKQIKFILYTFFPEYKTTEESRYDKKKYSKYKNKKKEILANFKKFPDLKIVKYSEGMNIWADRGYYNQKNDNKINNLFLIKHQRHNNKEIIINSKKDLEIIRVICILNDNQNYNDWKKLDYELLIIGKSCIHDQVFLKRYKAGKIIIFPGGPTASDPIFINHFVSEIDLKN